MVGDWWSDRRVTGRWSECLTDQSRNRSLSSLPHCLVTSSISGLSMHGAGSTALGESTVDEEAPQLQQPPTHTVGISGGTREMPGQGYGERNKQAQRHGERNKQAQRNGERNKQAKNQGTGRLRERRKDTGRVSDRGRLRDRGKDRARVRDRGISSGTQPALSCCQQAAPSSTKIKLGAASKAQHAG